MASREYIGTGGLRLTLDDPLSPQMAKQVASGQLHPADGEPADVEAGDKSLVVQHGSEADTVNRVGTHRRSPGEKPGEDASAGEWATYAVALGLNATQASTLSLTQLCEWVAAQEDLGDSAQDELPADGENLERPAKNAPVADWRAYAATRGMDPEQAETATKADCQDYVQVLDDAEAGE
ncbi:hypothetical protein ACGFZS_46740 [Streptomyces sp. NPDC048288]|uniref:hypothetical protein n=1 Tax=Streptomyces sp. NPDC048288 TaxID=3365529 RepID=UPI00371C89FB